MTQEVMHDRSNYEYYLLANHARQKSVVPLCGLQGQLCYAKLCFGLSEINFFFQQK